MRHETFRLTASDGLQLSGQVWIPSGQTKASVCLIHGLGEHCGRYVHVADAFNKAGFAVTAFDLRGHGKSEGRRGHAAGFEPLMDDIGLLLDHARSLSPDVPLILFGHSLGGSLVLHYGLKTKNAVNAIIASSPLLRLAFEPPVWQLEMLKTLNRFHVNLLIPSRIEAAALSRDPATIEAYKTDPLNHGRISPALAADMLEAGKWNLENAAALTLPVLLMHGSADRITSCDASREFAENSGENCTLKIWPGLFHELHNEPEKQGVIDFTVRWIKQFK